ncbi:SulP family inorganic anion transporter [Chitinilyticum litopenaei]|uniref:SulP family inorganic anion transporter n=1 Tax=Chitinilyticum litopenaei TaxID=1121276 RepID=UPI0003F7132D|nr:SulP family inorganic anion transporter [Chitinilyticum litopenaei]
MAPRWLPILHWLPGYGHTQLRSDLLASMVVALLLIPQGIAYALLAGLPPVAGLYASIVPLLVYTLLGSSMVQSVGPMAVTSAMTAAALGPLAASGSSTYAQHAMALTLLTGGWLVLLGLLRLDRLLRMISAPVLQGFADGIALLIIVGQLAPLLGISASGNTLPALLEALWQALPAAQTGSLLFGLAGLLLLWLAGQPLENTLIRAGLGARQSRLASRLAPPLLLLGATAWLAWRTQPTLAQLGPLAGGMPLIPPFPDNSVHWGALLWPALGIALAGFLQSISVARQLAGPHMPDSRQELLALGACNLASAAVAGVPVSGGFSRSAVNAAAGARTPMAGTLTALWLILVVGWLAQALATLPLAWLAATIVLAAARLIAPLYAWRLLQGGRAGWHEALPYLTTLLAVLLIGAISGLLAGVALSLLLFLLRASQPHLAILGRLPGTEHYRNVRHFQVETRPELLIARIDESLFFANSEVVIAALAQAVRAQAQTRTVLLCLAAVNHIDRSAADALLAWQRELAAQGIRLAIAELKRPVALELGAHPLLAALAGLDFVSTHAAVQALLPATNRQDEEGDFSI